MELEQLKQQWDILHKKLDEQQIINKKLMENAVTQKIDFISNYNWFGVALFIITIPFAWIMQSRHTPLDWNYFYFMMTVLIFYFIWDTYLTLLFDRTKKNKIDVISNEKSVLKFSKQRHLNSLTQFIVAIIIAIWGILHIWDKLIKFNTLESTIFIIVIIFIIGGWLNFNYFRKLNQLKQSISDLKEFEKE